MYLQIKNIQIRISINKVTKVKGFNNNLPLGMCFPVWDFDDVNLVKVVENLREIQRLFALPDIKVVESSPDHYHAICFKTMEWKTYQTILLNTPDVDSMFVSLAFMRGYATLRMSQRTTSSYLPHVIMTIPSPVHNEETEIRPLIKGVEYDTRTN